MLFNSGTQKEGKEQFVLLKQWSADIGIETEGKEVVDVQNSLLYVIGLYKTKSTVIKLLKKTHYNFQWYLESMHENWRKKGTDK